MGSCSLYRPVRMALGLAACAAAVSLAGQGRAGPADPAEPRRAAVGLSEAGAPGAQLYAENCAVCHDGGLNRAPQRIVLRNMSPVTIYRSMTQGAMRPQAAHLADAEMRAIAGYVADRPLVADVQAASPEMCVAVRAGFDRSRPPAFTGWGLDPEGTHAIGSEQAGITKRNVDSLRLKWAFGFAGASRVRSQPALAGGAIFTGSQDGRVYALDRETGCVRWFFDAPAEVRSTIVIEPWEAGDADADPLAFFGDLAGNAFAVKAFTGEPVWQRRVDDHPAAVLTASPALHGGTLLVPVSSLEEASAAAPGYICCSFRGSVVALDARTGEEKWRLWMAQEATPQGKTASGETRLGPAGAAIWGTPAVDEARGQLYVATSNNYSEPATGMSNAIVALDLETGAMRWHHQTLPGDVWNVDCQSRTSGACPENPGPDFGFGAATILAKSRHGRSLVLAGQKSGWAFALDPADGQRVWEQRVGRGGIAAGIYFGMAATDGALFVPVSDRPDGVPSDFPPSPGLYALDIGSGAFVWKAPAADGCGDGRPACDPGLGGAITATPELVFAGADDGWLRVHDAQTGDVLWQFDTVREFETINGVAARGGAISGGAAPIAHDGQLIVASGYGFASKMPGNALLVFETDQAGGR